MKSFDLYEKPIELMTVKERDDYFIKRTGKPYHEPTDEEIQETKKKYGLD